MKILLVDDLEVARISKRYGLANVVIKNHVSSTAGRAELVNKIVKGISVYGGIVLNHSVGDINPSAVESMALPEFTCRSQCTPKFST